MTSLQELAQLEDPLFYAGDPFPVYRRLREEAPVFWYEHDGVGFWALSKWKDIRVVSSDSVTYTTERGLIPVDLRTYKEFGRYVSHDSIIEGGHNILTSGPDLHKKLRKLVVRVFTPRMIQHLEPQMREIIHASFNLIEPGEPFDFVETLAVPLPMFVIADMLGIPREDRPKFKRWADNSVSGGAVVLDDDGAEATIERRLEVAAEMHDYFKYLLRKRASNPENDLISGIATSEVDGDRIEFLDQVEMCGTVLAAGNETVRNLISGAALELGRRPEQAELLRDKPELIGGAVDEFLRWVSPANSFMRTATTDTVIGGQEIREGDRLLLLYASGNRDEDVYERADEFDVSRKVDPMHVAFGWGPHLCLGQHLARVEAKLFYEEFLRKYSDFNAIGEAEKIPSTLINGIGRLPMVATAVA